MRVKMGGALRVPEVSVSANWRLLVISTAVLLITVGTSVAGPSETDSAQQPGRSPSLDALKRGYFASEKGEHEEAYSHFQIALEQASTSELRFQAHVGLGSAAAALGRLEEARENFEQALVLRPDNAETLFSLGLVAKQQNRFQEAASLFANAAVRNPSLSEAMVELGVVYEILGRHEEAADACWRAVTVKPEDQGALLCLGVARYHLGLYQGAAQAFEAVIEMNPDSVRARYGLGLAKIYLEDNEGAMVEYLALKPLDPDLAKDLYLRIPVEN
jgi:tetratricopeptide (TPR) repeat protein